MATKQGKRQFGNVRKLPSGRFQARYTGPDGHMHAARRENGQALTFETRGDANDWLSLRRSEILRNDWLPPATPTAAPVTVREFAQAWLAHRDLEDRTRERDHRAATEVPRNSGHPPSSCGSKWRRSSRRTCGPRGLDGRGAAPAAGRGPRRRLRDQDHRGRACRRPGRHRQRRSPGFWPWPDLYGDALVSLGEVDEADDFLAPTRRLPQRVGDRSAMARHARVRGRIAAARGDGAPVQPRHSSTASNCMRTSPCLSNAR